MLSPQCFKNTKQSFKKSTLIALFHFETIYDL